MGVRQTDSLPTLAFLPPGPVLSLTYSAWLSHDQLQALLFLFLDIPYLTLLNLACFKFRMCFQYNIGEQLHSPFP